MQNLTKLNRTNDVLQNPQHINFFILHDVRYRCKYAHKTIIKIIIATFEIKPCNRNSFIHQGTLWKTVACKKISIKNNNILPNRKYLSRKIVPLQTGPAIENINNIIDKHLQ